MKKRISSKLSLHFKKMFDFARIAIILKSLITQDKTSTSHLITSEPLCDNELIYLVNDFMHRKLVPVGCLPRLLLNFILFYVNKSALATSIHNQISLSLLDLFTTRVLSLWASSSFYHLPHVMFFLVHVLPTISYTIAREHVLSSRCVVAARMFPLPLLPLI